MRRQKQGPILENQVFKNLELPNLIIQWNLDLRKIAATTDFLVHKLFDLRKIF